MKILCFFWIIFLFLFEPTNAQTPSIINVSAVNTRLFSIVIENGNLLDSIAPELNSYPYPCEYYSPQMVTLHYLNKKLNVIIEQTPISIFINNNEELSIVNPTKLNQEFTKACKGIGLYDNALQKIIDELEVVSAQDKNALLYKKQLAMEARELALYYELKKNHSSILQLIFMIKHAKSKNLLLEPNKLFSMFSYCDTVQKSHQLYTYCKKLIYEDRYKLKLGDTIGELLMPNDRGEVVSVLKICSEKQLTYLDFWASYCGPCRKANKACGSIFDQYQNLVNFVSISRDTDRNAWLQASLDDGIRWTNLCDLRGKGSMPFFNFDAFSIPKAILINQAGVIVAYDFHPDYLGEMLKKHVKM